jgi:hypothetical protein
MADHPKIQLGQHEVPVYPQRHAYLTNRLGRFVDVLGSSWDGAGGVDDVVRLLGGSVYDVLCALIPNLGNKMPEYEFRGFGSREAMDEGVYDEREDKSPTLPEIIVAFETAARVNRFDVFKALKGLVDPKLLRAELSLKVSEALSTGSPSSPGTSGESNPNGSGTTGPTEGQPERGSEPGVPSRSSGDLLTTSA